MLGAQRELYPDTDETPMKIELPGLFDLQVNGFAGVDFNDPLATVSEIKEAVRAIRATGVTRFLATLITSPLDRFARCARTLLQVADPAIVGLHMEGPWISPQDGPRGAHPREYVTAASIEDFRFRQEAAGGRILLVTLAPEAPGALRVIETLVGENIRVAIGHTAATPEQIRAAICAGATLSTHLGNGCALVLPRHPNIFWEQLASDELQASLVVDGHHLPPATDKAMIRAKTPARTILITDAMAAAGSPPGSYFVNGQKVELSPDGRVSPAGKPWLAGSSLTLSQAVANTVKFSGVPFPDAWAMASSQPAAYLGLATAGTLLVNWDPSTWALSVLKATNSPPG